MNNKNKSSSGLGLLEVLLVIFVVLKLCGLIDWSWPIGADSAVDHVGCLSDYSRSGGCCFKD